MPLMTIGNLAELVGGRVLGNPSIEIRDALPLQDAAAECITLVDDAKLAEKLAESRVAAAVVPVGFPSSKIALIEVSNPHAAFERIVTLYRNRPTNGSSGVHWQASVHESACIGRGTVIHAGATVGANCTIGQRTLIHAGVQIMERCSIGDDCTLFPSVVLYPDTVLRDRVLIHAASVLGAYGFGYRMTEGRHERTPQLGWVQIESDVELGACVTIDRGTYGPTTVGEGTKIDNQVMIGHNCKIGRHNLICAQVGIAGSCSTGDYVVLAGQVGIKDHTHLGHRVAIGAQSGIMQNVPDDAILLGTPAISKRLHMQVVAVQYRLPEMRRQLRELEAQVAALTHMDTAQPIDPETLRRAA